MLHARGLRCRAGPGRQRGKGTRREGSALCLQGRAQGPATLGIGPGSLRSSPTQYSTVQPSTLIRWSWSRLRKDPRSATIYLSCLSPGAVGWTAVSTDFEHRALRDAARLAARPRDHSGRRPYLEVERQPAAGSGGQWRSGPAQHSPLSYSINI